MLFRSPGLVRVCYVLSEISFISFCGIVFWYSLSMLENMSRFKQVSASLEIDVKYAYLIIPLSMVLTMFRTAQVLYRDYRKGSLRFEAGEE